PAHLLAEEAVVIVATVERDVVEDSALTVKVDLVTVWTLRDANARGECEEVFKFATKRWGGAHGLLVECGTGFGLHGVDERRVGYDDAFGSLRDLHCQIE